MTDDSSRKPYEEMNLQRTAAVGLRASNVVWIEQDLTRRDFSDARLAGSTLTNSNFAGCAMYRADLSFTIAGGARFERAGLGAATLSSAFLSGANFDDANCINASFEGADVQGASFVRANVSGASFTGANLAGARFAETSVSSTTRLAGCLGLDGAIVDSIIVENIGVASRPIQGIEARAWLTEQRRRRAWSVEDFELWALGKMSGSMVIAGAAQLGATEADLRHVAKELDAVFDQPGHTAAEYRRALGEPAATSPAEASGMFAGSLRHEYRLPLWPGVVYVVNEDRNGTAWGFGFEGGLAALPQNLDEIEPWRWTAERLRRESTSIEVHEEWSYDLEATLGFATPSGTRRYRARFDLGLLQRWEPQPG